MASYQQRLVASINKLASIGKVKNINDIKAIAKFRSDFLNPLKFRDDSLPVFVDGEDLDTKIILNASVESSGDVVFVLTTSDELDKLTVTIDKRSVSKYTKVTDADVVDGMSDVTAKIASYSARLKSAVRNALISYEGIEGTPYFSFLGEIEKDASLSNIYNVKMYTINGVPVTEHNSERFIEKKVHAMVLILPYLKYLTGSIEVNKVPELKRLKTLASVAGIPTNFVSARDRFDMAGYKSANLGVNHKKGGLDEIFSEVIRNKSIDDKEFARVLVEHSRSHVNRGQFKEKDVDELETRKGYDAFDAIKSFSSAKDLKNSLFTIGFNPSSSIPPLKSTSSPPPPTTTIPTPTPAPGGTPSAPSSGSTSTSPSSSSTPGSGSAPTPSTSTSPSSSKPGSTPSSSGTGSVPTSGSTPSSGSGGGSSSGSTPPSKTPTGPTPPSKAPTPPSKTPTGPTPAVPVVPPLDLTSLSGSKLRNETARIINDVRNEIARNPDKLREYKAEYTARLLEIKARMDSIGKDNEGHFLLVGEYNKLNCIVLYINDDKLNVSTLPRNISYCLSKKEQVSFTVRSFKPATWSTDLDITLYSYGKVMSVGELHVAKINEKTSIVRNRGSPFNGVLVDFVKSGFNISTKVNGKDGNIISAILHPLLNVPLQGSVVVRIGGTSYTLNYFLKTKYGDTILNNGETVTITNKEDSTGVDIEAVFEARRTLENRIIFNLNQLCIAGVS